MSPVEINVKLVYLPTSNERKYVFLSNGVTSSLELDGSIDWFPCPKFDSPSIFTKILDSTTGGHFSVRPEGNYSLDTKYIKDTLVVENTFSTSEGKLSVKDFMPLGLPAIIRIFDSEIPFLAEIKPMFNYGMIIPSLEHTEGGLVFRNGGSNEGIEISMDCKYTVLEDGVLRIGPGRGYMFAMYSRDLRYGLFSNKGFVFPDPYDSLNNIVNYWREQLMPSKKVPKFQDMYNLSILVTLGLMYAPSGAIIAGPTAGLPEIVGESRNWDYRYMWVRDAAYAAEALMCAGYRSKAKRILDFMMSVMDPSSKSFDHPLYSIDGTAPPPEESIGWLSGNKGSRPVYIGNSAYMQVQMDTEGAFMNALHMYLGMTGEKSYIIENWILIESVVKWISKSWTMESANIWEERNLLRHFVHTKVMQWVAIDRAAKLADAINQSNAAAEWRKLADSMRQSIIANGFSKEENSFVQYYGSKEVDLSLLTLPIYDFIDANDPMFASTLNKIEKDLLIGDGLLLRYKSDFMGNAAHPFTLSSFWLIRVYLRMGNTAKAEKIMEETRKFANDFMLFSEHVDYKTLEPRGNFPQLFPHAGLIHAIAEMNDPTLYFKNGAKSPA